MSTGKWLEKREPGPPVALASRLSTALGAVSTRPQFAEDHLFAAAEILVERLLRTGCGTRSSAYDLLAADALVTYAFEAAAERLGSKLEERAAEAMRRIATLGTEHAV